jgi:non-homologous end joining protein Ku
MFRYRLYHGGARRRAAAACASTVWAGNPDHGRLTGHRIRLVTVDAETDEEVQRRDLVKGYEFGKNRYLLPSNADFDSVKVESSSVMNVEKFVPMDSIGRIYYASSY